MFLIARRMLLLLLFAMVCGACNLPDQNGTKESEISVAETVGAVVTQTVKAQEQDIQNQTAVAATVMAQLKQLTSAITETGTATAQIAQQNTLVLSATPTSTSTETPIPPPCNWAGFVNDITYPDNSQVGIGESFVKTWRFSNKGTCTWTSQYQLVFDHGERMSAPDSVNMTNSSVITGDSVDISVNLQAPLSAGSYQAFFRFKAPDGSLFGIGNQANSSFWAIIDAVDTEVSVPEPAAAGADLIVQSSAANPSSFMVGNSTTISVVVKNNGDAEAGDFKVSWFSGEATLSPKCSWDVAGLGAAEATAPLSCNYTYPKSGQYNSNIVVDSNTQVSESDEGNNEKSLQIKVLMKFFLTPIKITPIKPLKPMITLSP